MSTKTNVALGVAAGMMAIGVGANVAHWVSAPEAPVGTAAPTHISLSPSPLPSSFGDNRVSWAGGDDAPEEVSAPTASSPVPTDQPTVVPMRSRTSGP